MMNRHGDDAPLPAVRFACVRIDSLWKILALLAGPVLIGMGSAPVLASPDPQSSLADRLKAVQSGEADHPVAKLPAWKAAGADAFKTPIPVIPGLTIVTAVNQPPWGDYESIKLITDVSATAVQMHYSANKPKFKADSPLLARPKDLGQADPMQEFPDKVACTRVIDVADLAKAAGYSELFCEHSAEHFPGSTSVGASTDLLARLSTGQSVDFHFANADKWAQFAQLGAQIEGQKPTGPQLSKFAGQMMYSCKLQRVGATDVAVPVLVNDQRVLLPAVHASCGLEDGQQIHFYWLDQPGNAITLAFVIDQTLLQTISIKFPLNPPQSASKSAPVSPMEQALSDKKPVQIYGIYFDFNSAAIKPESEPVLREIAAIMLKNPDWKLSVSGNTDNIGDAKSNLALSQKRAAAVKDALVTRFKIAPDRLDTSGNGAARPIETNDTLEGRARNRRVELQRE